jgi:ATP-dependent DNA ligase
MIRTVGWSMAGRVGTGITQAELERLWRRLQPLATAKSEKRSYGLAEQTRTPCQAEGMNRSL